jgi:hypothetical protein
MKPLNASMARKLLRYQNQGKIFSTNLGKQTDTVEKLLGKCARMIFTKHFQDDLKAPVNNVPRSAKLAPAAFNVYFGANTSKTNNPNTVKRAAYAFGSGATSIGLDPRTMRLNPLFPDLIKLAKKATEIVNRDPHRRKAMGGKVYNACSVKIYYWTRRDNKDKTLVQKTVDWHVDVTRDKAGNPRANNSQVPETPVAILTYGTEKRFKMRKHRSPTSFLKSTAVEFRQKSGYMMVLDARDEKIVGGQHWRHMSEAGDDKDGITFSFLFRVVQMEAEVYLHDNTLVDKTCGKMKLEQFKKAGTTWSKTTHYCNTITEIHDRMDSLFNAFP